MNQDILDRINARMASIRGDLNAGSDVEKSGALPGRTFFMGRDDSTGRGADLLLILEKDESRQTLLCCRMSVEIFAAAEFDLLLNPEDWTGGYSIMAEAWNTILLPAEDISESDIQDAVEPARLDQVISLHRVFREELAGHGQMGESCGFAAEAFHNERRPIQAEERENRRQLPQQPPKSPEPGPAGRKIRRSRKLQIHRIFQIDRRAGFDMPYLMTRRMGRGQIVPVESAPASGDWDILQVKGRDLRAGCFVSPGIFGRSWIERTELKSIEWIEINRKIHKILGTSGAVEKIRGLEKLFAQSEEDPYVAFHLAWLLLFEGSAGSALDYLTFAEKNFPYPEFKNLAAKAKAILLQKDAPAHQKADDIFHQVWRIRILQSDADTRIAMMKKLWLRTNSGYVAYELAREYKYFGAFAETVDYRHYCTMLKWARNALNAKIPIDAEMIKWVEDIRNRIAPPILRIEEGNCGDVSRIYVPLRGAA